MPSPSTAVQLTSVEVRRAGRRALTNVSFDIPLGSITAVIGPNGAGKSSLFGLLSGRLDATSGDVRVDGPVAEVLQHTSIDESLAMTVEDVVRMGRFEQRGLFGRLGARDKQLIDSAICAMAISDLRRRPVHQLSGGQKQRVLVAQGLAQDAPILLLDEVTTGLDLPSQALIKSAIQEAVNSGKTVLFATHDLHEAAAADYLIVLASECVCCAPPVDAFADPAVTALFSQPASPLTATPTSPVTATQLS